ncbi:MAG: M48 family metalloprotease [bacterium]|nr:M48 family metalloprotease [bacterium]
MTRFVILRRQYSLIVVFVLFLGGGCSYQLGNLNNPGGGFNLIPQGTEIQIGMEAAAAIESQEKVLVDSYVQNYVNQLGQRLVQHSRRPDIAYQFKVVDSDEMNAFALPGGFIYVNRGLIAEASSEAELAGVIGHEIGHVAAKHGAKRMTKLLALQLGFAVFWELSDRDRETKIKLLIADAVATGFLLKNNRDNERQADDLGTETLYNAGYDPVAMAHFFDKLGKDYSSGAAGVFLSTHPSPGERVKNVEWLIASFQPKPYTANSPEFQNVKQRLASGGGNTPQPEIPPRRQGLKRKAVGTPGSYRRR